MSLHSSDNVARFKAAEKTKRFGRRGAILGLGLAVFAASGVAYAAMLIFGSGQATADPYTAKPLVVSDAKFSTEIYPGATPDLTFKVKNENPFPVKVQKLGLDGDPNSAVSGTCIQGNNLSLISTTLPVSGVEHTLATQPVVAPGQTVSVTVPDALTYDANLTKTQGCSLTIKFKVTGTQSGN